MRGAIIVEGIIALGILAIMLAAVVTLTASTLEAPGELRTERAALSLGQRIIEDVRTHNRLFATDDKDSFLREASGTVDTTYDSPCVADISVVIRYASGWGRAVSMPLWTAVSDPSEAARLGNDCMSAIPPPDIGPLPKPTTTPLSGVATALDALDGLIYIGLAEPPYLMVVDMRSGGSLVPFDNDFSLPAAPNDLDAIAWDGNDGRHVAVYAALASTTSQLATVDLTKPSEPTLTTLATLAGVDPFGSYPQGWRIRYYDGRVYEATRETSGPELHSFDATDPLHLLELGTGMKIGITLNAIALDESPDRSKRYLFAAADRVAGEVAVYDATDPNASGAIQEIPIDRTDLPGTQNGESLALIGRKLYVGRTSVLGGADLYVFDAATPDTSLAMLGSADAGAGIASILPWGRFAIIGSTKASSPIQVWDIASSTSMHALSGSALAPGRATGLDLSGLMLYAISGSLLDAFAVQ